MNVRGGWYNVVGLELCAVHGRAPDEEAMARPRKKHLQQVFEFRRHGGRRAGAGRPPKGARSSEPHKTRDEIDHRHPILVTTRVVDGLGSLRRSDAYLAVRAATLTVISRADFRIVELSIQHNHLHLIAEAADAAALSSGMQAFLISIAKRINGETISGKLHRGKVFADRYHARPLSSPRAVRNALCYVLNNWRRHREDQLGVAASWKIDPYSSAIGFAGWKEREGVRFPLPVGYRRLATRPATTWLLRIGWRRHELISFLETPGPAPSATHSSRRLRQPSPPRWVGSPVRGFCGSSLDRRSHRPQTSAASRTSDQEAWDR